MTEKVVRNECWCFSKDEDPVTMVRYSDYEALAARVEELEAKKKAVWGRYDAALIENNRLREALDRIVRLQISKGRVMASTKIAQAALQEPTDE